MGKMFPLPPELINLPSLEAEPWFQVHPDADFFLEGPVFDLEGNLFVVSPPNGTVLKITPQKHLTTVFEDKNVLVNGSAFHRNDRLFVVCLTGELLSMNSDGSEVSYTYPKYRGKKLSMNDLVFNSKGDIYVTDFSGTVMNPTGGVYRLSSDGNRVHPVLRRLASPNGISLSPEGNVLWIGETTRNAILRIELLDDGITPNPVAGITYPYYSTGCPGGPDSNKVDKKGNLYQCLIFQGRAVVLNKCGIPVANVVIPGREEGKHLVTPNLAFKPGTDEAFIIAGGEGGAWIYRFQGLAEGLHLFYGE